MRGGRYTSRQTRQVASQSTTQTLSSIPVCSRSAQISRRQAPDLSSLDWQCWVCCEGGRSEEQEEGESCRARNKNVRLKGPWIGVIRPQPCSHLFKNGPSRRSSFVSISTGINRQFTRSSLPFFFLPEMWAATGVYACARVCEVR